MKAAPEMPDLPKPLTSSKHWDDGIDWRLAGERAARLEREDQLRGALGQIAALTAERDGLSAEIKSHTEQHVILRREYDALKQQVADNDLAFNHANEIIGKLEEQVARLSAPVSVEELKKAANACPSEGERLSSRLDRIIASRTFPAQKEPE